MLNFWNICTEKLNDKFLDAGLLIVRIWVSQEFIRAGLIKLTIDWMAPAWFVELKFPFPLNHFHADINWIVAGGFEIILGISILLGLFTRYAAILLLYIVFVAVYAVHFDLGWDGWDQIDTDAGQGFKIPLMISVMLFNLATQGAGRFSWDAFIESRKICKIPT